MGEALQGLLGLVTDAPFYSVAQAIQWSFKTLSRLILKTSSLGTWRGAEYRGSTLSPQEAHGQAVQICKAIETLSQLEQAYLRAKYLNPRLEADQRKGMHHQQIVALRVPPEVVAALGLQGQRGKVNPAWAAAITKLAHYLRDRVDRRANLKPYRLLVEMSFNRARNGYRPFRKLLKAHDNQALAMRRAGYAVLDLLDVQTESRLYYRLMGAGFVNGKVEWTTDARLPLVRSIKDLT